MFPLEKIIYFEKKEMTKINDTYVCVWCGEEIWPASKTCRNHCSHCFLSLHVDDKIPGDRASDCEGLMIPIEYLIANGTTKIHFQCIVCGKYHWNKIADDDEIAEINTWIGYRKAKTTMCCY